jgi:hypothetical protein
MKKELVTALNNRFAGTVQECLPQFQICDRDGDTTFWSWTLTPDLIFFLMLQPFDNKDAFTIEIAWTNGPQFPYCAPLPYDVRLPEGRLRLSSLWWKPGRREYVWAMVPDDPDDLFWQNMEVRRRRGEKFDRRINPRPAVVADLLYRVEPLVEDAMQKLMEYALPLYRQVAERHGLSWPGVK